MRRRSLLLFATLAAAFRSGKPAGAQTATEDDPEAMRPLSAIASVAPPKPLPSLALPALDGGTAALTSFRGRSLVLNFWATWCAPCIRELPELDKLAASPDAPAVLAISADRGGAATVRPFLAAHPASHLRVLLDPHSEAVQALGVVGFPTTFVIDRDGHIRGQLVGPTRWGEAGPVIARLTA